MVKKFEIYIITKNEGTLLNKFSLLDAEETSKDQLVSGFLTALNEFAKQIDFPDGVSLIRSGNLEARFAPGEIINTVLIIDYAIPLNQMTEPIIAGLSKEITHNFEEKYKKQLQKGTKSGIYHMPDFKKFGTTIENLIDKYGNEAYELYQKLILIESLYTKVPQKWIQPLFEFISEGGDIEDKLATIPKAYQKQLKKAVEKTNYENSPLWSIFALQTYQL